jgi:UDP-3-O-acyl-N-acetylglucosamine deacetylase
MKKRIQERIVPISKADRSFDIEFWQRENSITRFRTAFDMLKEYYRMKGKKINARTFRLQRSAEALKQAPG